MYFKVIKRGTNRKLVYDFLLVLGVTFSSDLSLEKHVSKTCAVSFHWLRQLRRIRKSLDDRVVKTAHSF